MAKSCPGGRGAAADGRCRLLPTAGNVLCLLNTCRTGEKKKSHRHISIHGNVMQIGLSTMEMCKNQIKMMRLLGKKERATYNGAHGCPKNCCQRRDKMGKFRRRVTFDSFHPKEYTELRSVIWARAPVSQTDRRRRRCFFRSDSACRVTITSVQHQSPNNCSIP